MDKRKLSNEIMRPKKHVPVVVHPLVRDQFGIFWRQLVFFQANRKFLEFVSIGIVALGTLCWSRCSIGNKLCYLTAFCH